MTPRNRLSRGVAPPLIVLAILVLVPCGPAPAAAETTLSLRVLDPHDLPVAGATIDVGGASSRTEAVTDQQGEATVSADLPLRLVVRAAGFEPHRVEVDSLPAGQIDIRLVPATVRATVDVTVREPASVATGIGTAVAVERTAARTVFDAIDVLVPGVSVTRRGVMGYGIATNGTGGVSIGGVGGQPNTGVLIVVDGRPDVQALMGHPLPDAYMLADAQAVRVTTAPASVLYGSNAMGGVVDIDSAAVSPGRHLRVSSSLGSFRTGQHRAAFGAAKDGREVTVTAAADHTGGDRVGSSYRGETATVNAATSLAGTLRARVRGRFTNFRVEDPGPVTAPLVDSHAKVNRGGFSVDLDNAGGRTWGYARVYASFGHHVITDGFRSHDRMVGARLVQAVHFGGASLVEAGTDLRRFGGVAENVNTSLDYGEHRGTSAAVFVRGQHDAGRGVELQGGVRYDRDSLVEKATVAPEAGLSWRASERVSASFTVGRGFRNPTIRELFLFPAPNPLLRPESLWNWQARLDLRPHASLGGWISARYASLQDQIVTVGRFPNLSLQNAGAAINKGLEGMLTWRPVRGWQVNAGYAWLRSTNLAPLVPSHKLTAGASFALSRAFVDLTVMRVGRRWADGRHVASLASFETAALRLTVPVRRGLNLFGTLDNLPNQAYEMVPGYPMPGVNGALGFTWGF